jgi:hypothetical protein
VSVAALGAFTVQVPRHLTPAFQELRVFDKVVLAQFHHPLLYYTSGGFGGGGAADYYLSCFYKAGSGVVRRVRVIRVRVIRFIRKIRVVTFLYL